MKKDILPILIVNLFILSTISPIVFGYNVKSINNELIVGMYNFNSYNAFKLSNYSQDFYLGFCKDNNIKSKRVLNQDESLQLLDGTMDSPWPMYCHDARHTGHSPYNTINTSDEIWRFKEHMGYYVLGSPVIGDDGTIYFGGLGIFYALYPNGTLKWKYEDLEYYVWSAPAIDENGTIYFGDCDGYFYSIDKDGTKKWIRKFSHDIKSSPVIGNDGTIYFGDSDYYINALYPNNGSVRWRYKTGLVVYSSPAIGNDGTVYCGSHDNYLYALYPNNGTLKWRYKTGGWIRTSPCIGDDCTIYVVSLDNYLHAVNPDGSMKWKTNVGAGASPTIGWDGTIYAGYEILYAVNPTNGSVKWTYDVPGKIKGGTPCNSIDGIIYFGTDEGGKFIGVNPDGTERLQVYIGACNSAPAIGENGVIYIGSNSHYLHAFGPLDPNAPSSPTIIGKTKGTAGTQYEYKFKSISPLGRDIFYNIEWGDGKIDDWFGPFCSGDEVTISHSWSEQGTYTIKARAKDTENLWGSWGELTVTMSRIKPLTNSLFLRFLDRFLSLEKLLNLNLF